MTIPTFPVLPGIGFPKRSPVWSTIKQPSIGGQESRFAQWSYPKWRYEYPFEVLRNYSGFTEFDSLAGFYNQMYGSAGFFQFNDPSDGSISNQALGVGDGSTRQFQLVRTRGGFTEPVFIWTTANIFVNGVISSGDFVIDPIFATAFWTFNGPSNGWFAEHLSGSGPATLGVPHTASLWDGAWTGTAQRDFTSALMPCAAGSGYALSAIGHNAGNRQIGLFLSFFDATPTIISTVELVWDVGAGVGARSLTTVSPPSAAWMQIVGRLFAGAAYSGQAALSNIVVTSAGIVYPGLVTFPAAPAAGAAISWTGTYNWLCRFDDDSVDFQAIASGYWSAGSLKFTTEKL